MDKTDFVAQAELLSSRFLEKGYGNDALDQVINEVTNTERKDLLRDGNCRKIHNNKVE